MAEPKDLTYRLGFAMATDESTEPLRHVAQHCAQVGDAWIVLADELDRLADAMEVLVRGPAAAEGEPT